MNYVLRQIPPNNRIRPIEIHLTEKEVHIGRKNVNSLVKYVQISRDHAKFYKSDNDILYVKDQGSLNGLYVNGENIGSSPKPLSVGDVIGFGVSTTNGSEGFVCTLCIDNPSDEVKEVYLIDSATDNQCGATTSSDKKLISTDSELQTSVLYGKNTPDGIQIIPLEILPKKVCLVPLIKCDSKFFKWPPDVKNPFSDEHEYAQCLNRRRRRARQICSDSSSEEENCEERTAPSSSFNKHHSRNASLELQNSINMSIVCHTRNIVKQELIPVIDCFDSSDETPPDSPKKLCMANDGINRFPDCKVKSEVNKESVVKKPCLTNDVINKFPDCNVKHAAEMESLESQNDLSILSKEETFCSSSFKKNINTSLELQNKNISIVCQTRSIVNQELIPVIDCFDSSEKMPPVSPKKPCMANDAINRFLDCKIKSEVNNKSFEKEACLTSDDINIFPDCNVARSIVKQEFIPVANSFDSSEEMPPVNPKKPCMTNDAINRFPNCKIISEANKKSLEKSSCLTSDDINIFPDCNTKNAADKENIEKEPCMTKNVINIFPDCNLKDAADKESLEFQNDSCKTLNYSQVEEIIYISDDETYLDFKSSQNFVQVKIEPEAIDDSENEICKAIFKNGIEPTSGSFVPRNKEIDINEEESIELVLTFINCIAQENPKELRFDACEETNFALMNNELFPALLQNADKNEENGFEDNSNLLHSDKLTLVDNIIEQTPETSDDKKSSKILLTDPKPMFYRSHRVRGKDEGFVAQNKPVDVTPIEQKRQRGRPRKVSLGTETMDPNSTKKCTPKDLQPMSSQSRHNQGDGGFVENIKPVNLAEVQQKRKRGRPRKEPLKNENANSNTSEKLFKVPHKSKASDLVHKDYLPKEMNLKNVNPSSSTNVRDVKNRAVKTVKIRSEKFSSRMGFLINELEITPQGRSKAVAKPGTHSNMHNDKSEKVQQTFLNATDASAKSNSPQRTVSQDIAANKSVTTSSQTFNSFSTFSNSRDPRLKSLQSRGSKCVPLFSAPIITPKMYSPLPNVPEKSSAIAGNSLPYNMNFQGLVNTLIQLNTKWLQEQAALELPPPAVIHSAVNLPLNYKSYESYASSFFPMIKLEIWESMYVESKVSKKFYFSVLSYMSREDCIELKCESVIDEDVYFAPHEGVIVILEMKKNSQMYSPLFGYIYKHRINPLNMDSLNIPDWKNLPEEVLINARHWTFYAYIRKKETSFALDCLMKGWGLCYIRSKLRLADALHLVKDSPLLTNILEPKLSTFSTQYSVSPPTREYTRRQMEVIRGINTEIDKSQLEPKIILLHGPPGTGKTHTIIGLLEMLFYNCKNKSNLKILITAPSDVAIDEIGCRIIELNERFSWKDYSIKFVRVGKVEKQIHPKMIPYFLDKKAKDLYQLNSQASKRKEKELQALHAEILKLKQAPASTDGQEKLQCLTKLYHYFQKQPSTDEMNYYTGMTNKSKILKESNVVLSTLSSCGLSLMLRTFKPNSGLHFSCCIVDESTQCTELEILQPLVLGISKLILVGDQKQLPATVLSKLAMQYGLGRSMFERFRLHFESTEKKAPMLILNEQLRMHSTICEFPSKHIYAARTFLTHPDTNLRYKEFPLHPYIVLDVSETPVGSSNQPHQGDCNETSIILTICKFLMDVVDCPSSIGIITSSQDQRFQYTETLYTNPLYKGIEINFVDAFQGREKDVIVVSSLNANHNSDGTRFLKSRQQLNVALTRAKQCLIVCVHSAALNVYPEWKKLIEDAQKRKLLFPVISSDNLLFVLRNCLKKK